MFLGRRVSRQCRDSRPPRATRTIRRSPRFPFSRQARPVLCSPREAQITLANAESTNIMAVANSPALWAAVAGIFLVIIVQSAIYITAVRKVAPVVDLSREDMKVSFRSGAVSAIGPSHAVCLVAIALLALFGAPAVLARIGLIGSAAYDMSAEHRIRLHGRETGSSSSVVIEGPFEYFSLRR